MSLLKIGVALRSETRTPPNLEHTQYIALFDTLFCTLYYSCIHVIAVMHSGENLSRGGNMRVKNIKLWNAKTCPERGSTRRRDTGVLEHWRTGGLEDYCNRQLTDPQPNSAVHREAATFLSSFLSRQRAYPVQPSRSQ